MDHDATGSRAAKFPDVKGRCPACGYALLFLGSGGYVACSWHKCPDPDAPSRLLAEADKLGDLEEVDV